MARPVLTELALFLLPFVVYGIFLWWFLRHTQKVDTPGPDTR